MPRARCPQCQKSIEWKGNSYRPFCSERCKMIDLGKWISEEYRVKGAPADLESGQELPNSNQDADDEE